MKYIAFGDKGKRVSWFSGVIIAPFVVVGIIVATFCVCLAMITAALCGRITKETTP